MKLGHDHASNFLSTVVKSTVQYNAKRKILSKVV